MQEVLSFDTYSWPIRELRGSHHVNLLLTEIEVQRTETDPLCLGLFSDLRDHTPLLLTLSQHVGAAEI